MRVAVMGHETATDSKSKKPYTLYRTAVVLKNGESHERLIRFRDFHAFASHGLKSTDKKLLTEEFPKKHLRQTKSCSSSVVKLRVKMLDRWIRQVSSINLSEKGAVAFRKMLQVGEFTQNRLMQPPAKSANQIVRSLMPESSSRISNRFLQSNNKIQKNFLPKDGPVKPILAVNPTAMAAQYPPDDNQIAEDEEIIQKSTKKLSFELLVTKQKERIQKLISEKDYNESGSIETFSSVGSAPICATDFGSLVTEDRIKGNCMSEDQFESSILAQVSKISEILGKDDVSMTISNQNEELPSAF